jgi:hypothetical protein
VHGAQGFASTFEEAQKMPLGKALAGLSVRIYRVLQVSALYESQENARKLDRKAGKANFVYWKEEINDFSFAVRVLKHCRILQ